MKRELVIDGPSDAACRIVLAHGAGAGMHTDFMNFFAAGLAQQNLQVVRFDFPYMAQIQKTGKRRPPDREPVLRESWLAVLESLAADMPLVIGGKSMGGRIASLIADQSDCSALVCLGYPFHPSGRPQQLRTEHLQTLRTPTLIVQGERDPLGRREEVEQYGLPDKLNFCWLADGDHSFKPRKASGRTTGENWQDGIEAVARFALAAVS